MDGLNGQILPTANHRNEVELLNIAAGLLGQLRQERLTIGDIKRIAGLLSELTDSITFIP